MEPLTGRQAEILAFIRRHLSTHGAPPTRAEIVSAFGFRSPTAAEDHLRALARKGAIRLVPGASRGIRLEEAANDALGLPLVGRVAAGSPIMSDPNLESRIPVPPEMFRPRADFFLRVRGDSMRDAGILDGDFLAVHQQATAHDGQIVVARMGDEITVKRFRREGDVVRLFPANPDYAPIRVDLARQELVIEGLAVGLIRNGGIGRL
jgi:repressor LexA